MALELTLRAKVHDTNRPSVGVILGPVLGPVNPLIPFMPNSAAELAVLSMDPFGIVALESSLES